MSWRTTQTSLYRRVSLIGSELFQYEKSTFGLFYCFCSINFQNPQGLCSSLFSRRLKLSLFLGGCKRGGQILSLQGLKLDLIFMRSGVGVYNSGGPVDTSLISSSSISFTFCQLLLFPSQTRGVWSVAIKRGILSLDGAGQTTGVTAVHRQGRRGRCVRGRGGRPSCCQSINIQNPHHVEVQGRPRVRLSTDEASTEHDFLFPRVRLSHLNKSTDNLRTRSCTPATVKIPKASESCATRF